MNTPHGDDGVDDSALNRCPHGVLEDEDCFECEGADAGEDDYDPGDFAEQGGEA